MSQFEMVHMDHPYGLWIRLDDAGFDRSKQIEVHEDFATGEYVYTQKLKLEGEKLS